MTKNKNITLASRTRSCLDSEGVEPSGKCKYKSPAKYDQELTLHTRIVRQTAVRIDHAYELRRGQTLLAEASTTIACVDREGQLREIPEYLRPSQ